MVGPGGAERTWRQRDQFGHAHTLECPSKASVAKTEILRRKAGGEV